MSICNSHNPATCICKWHCYFIHTTNVQNPFFLSLTLFLFLSPLLDNGTTTSCPNQQPGCQTCLIPFWAPHQSLFHIFNISSRLPQFLVSQKQLHKSIPLHWLKDEVCCGCRGMFISRSASGNRSFRL